MVDGAGRGVAEGRAEVRGNSEKGMFCTHARTHARTPLHNRYID